MVHSSLMASVKKGVSPTNPKQQAAIPFFGHTEILHMLVSMGSTALAAAVVLPRYGGLNYACGINEDWKRKTVTLHNFVERSCKNIEQKCFIYHQMYHGDWESHRECLINTCINWWRHGIEYTQVQKLSNLLQKCTNLNKLLPQNVCYCASKRWFRHTCDLINCSLILYWMRYKESVWKYLLQL